MSNNGGSAITKDKKKSKEFPHLFVLLLAMIVIAGILTYVVPAGQFERVLNENTGREVIDPESFQYMDKTPVGPFELLKSVVEGLIQAANISMLIFIAYAALHLVQKTGTMDASISWMVKKAKQNPNASNAAIAITMVVFAVWASTGTLSFEEIIAFIPIFCTLSIALGYDPLVALGMSYIPVGIGFASATVNPFSIGVAQGIAELPLFSGLKFRIVALVVMTTVSVLYVLAYAKKIKKDPSKSLVSDLDFSAFKLDEDKMNTPFTKERRATLVVLFIGITIMVVGLIKLHWYINEVSAVFLGIAVFTGLVNKWRPNKVANIFVEGLSGAVLSALTVGLARGILVVISKGNILDTLIYSAATVLNQMSLYASGVGMLIFQTLLNLFIPSGSGQAATTMPIMVPLADLIGMKRQIAVLAFQFGDGFSNLIWPTSFVLIACAMAKVPVNKYYKWFLPLFFISFIIQIVFIMVAIKIGYGPF